MSSNPLDQPANQPTSTMPWFFIALATVAYAGFIGGIVTPAASVTISSIALAALGIALAALVRIRLSAGSEPRLAARAIRTRRNYNILALVNIGMLYLVLVGGAILTSAGGLWECLALPFCPTSTDIANPAMAHRILAALATVLTLALAIQTWRVRKEAALRRAAWWLIGLMIAQNVAGSLQVLIASTGDSLPTTVMRLAHLGLGALTWGVLVVLATMAARLPWQDTEAQPASENPLRAKIEDYISLTKPGVITLLIFTTITSMYITPAGQPELALVLWTALGGWLMSSGAHSINCYLDRDIDINMGRTSRRPIPSGRIPAWHALVLGIVLGVIAFVILTLFVNLLAAVLSMAGLLYYVFIYTAWLKRNTPHNIVIGGGAGAFPPLVGWAAATGSLSLESLLLFAIIFYWTPPHFWALALIRQKDYARAGIPMLPVVAGDDHTRWQILLYTIMMVALTILPTPLGMLGLPYLAMAIVFGGVFLYYAIRLYREPTTAITWGLYKFSLLYLALIFFAMLVDRVWLA